MSRQIITGLHVLCACLLLLAAAKASAGAPEAMSALKQGDYDTAYREFSALAEQGDTKAMITIGMFFYEGDGFPQDYRKAMDWFHRAMVLGNGDGYNNIGVMFRDGKGVEVNRAIAYDLFLIVHMAGMGSQGTQTRANRNLRREVRELGEDQIKYALCLSEAQVLAYVEQRGTTPAHTISPPGKHVAIKDREWWLDGELPEFDCST